MMNADAVRSESFPVKTTVFEGPFDLLYHLIEKNKIDIYDIPISLITDQYLDYIFDMQQINLDITSEFLVMASTLLHIKSRLLLPRPASEGQEGDEGDPRDELVISIIEYKRNKDFSADLRAQHDYWSKACYRSPDLYNELAVAKFNEVTLELDPEKLFAVYRDLLLTNRSKMDQIDQKVEKIMERETVPLHLKVREILNHLKKIPGFFFHQIYDDRHASRMEIATAFFALLELTKQNRVRLKQEKTFGELYISRSDGKRRNVPNIQ